MSAPVTETSWTPGALLLRAAVYLVLWIVFAGTGLKDFVAGVATAFLAAWLSLVLLPPGEFRLKPARALALFLRFPWQSVVAGVTVGRIALSPVMALRPGMVDYRTTLPPGNRRFLFMTYASLLPGTLPTGTGGDDAITVHALDCSQPVARQLADEEARLAAAVTGSAP